MSETTFNVKMKIPDVFQASDQMLIVQERKNGKPTGTININVYDQSLYLRVLKEIEKWQKR